MIHNYRRMVKSYQIHFLRFYELACLISCCISDIGESPCRKTNVRQDVRRIALAKKASQIYNVLRDYRKCIQQKRSENRWHRLPVFRGRGPLEIATTDKLWPMEDAEQKQVVLVMTDRDSRHKGVRPTFKMTTFAYRVNVYALLDNPLQNS